MIGGQTAGQAAEILFYAELPRPVLNRPFPPADAPLGRTR